MERFSASMLVWGSCHVRSGSDPEIRARNREVRFAMMNGLGEPDLSGPKSVLPQADPGFLIWVMGGKLNLR
jgi:hypothetical protein